MVTRQTLYAAADRARTTDPQLAAKYKRLMATERPQQQVRWVPVELPSVRRPARRGSGSDRPGGSSLG